MVDDVNINDAIFKCSTETGLVWISMINAGYIEYATNFFLAISHNKINLKIVLFCLDQESFKAFSSNDVSSCIAVDVTTFTDKKYSESLCTWKTEAYKDMNFFRLKLIKLTIQIARKKEISFVGLLDMDIVVLKDITEDVLQIMKESPSLQVLGLCDENLQTCSNINNCKNICLGTIVYRVKTINDTLFDYSAKDIKTFSCDQELLNNKFITTQTVKKPIWINGCYKGLNKSKIDVPNETKLIHFNWIIDSNYSKREAMKRQGLWFVKN